MGMPESPTLDPAAVEALRDERQVPVVMLHNSHHPIGFQLLQTGSLVRLPQSVAERMLAQGAVRKLSKEERASLGDSDPSPTTKGKEE